MDAVEKRPQRITKLFDMVANIKEMMQEEFAVAFSPLSFHSRALPNECDVSAARHDWEPGDSLSNVKTVERGLRSLEDTCLLFLIDLPLPVRSRLLL